MRLTEAVWLQTLSRTLDETNDIEPLRAGYGEGAFVVVKAKRPQRDF